MLLLLWELLLPTKTAMAINRIKTYFTKSVHIAPLAVFRIAFGLLMLASIIRFVGKGWVYDMYIKPKVFFSYYGFEWVKPFGETGMYALFILMALAALCITVGFFYRLSSILFFLTFTYVELIDKTNYLNHYYFISIVSLLMIFLPAHRYFSIDSWRKQAIQVSHIPNYFLLIIKMQVFIVYFFAGIAKINSDWLVEAMPLKIWLPAHSEMPLIGKYLTKEWVAYAFSWFGCIYDILIPFFLFSERTIKPAYFFVIIFHLATSLFFNIGMFPYVMICLTTIFFSEKFHIWLINFLRQLLKLNMLPVTESVYQPDTLQVKLLKWLMVVHFSVQLALPFRYLFYDENLFWTEQGFRFSWRVMLMEKAGTAFFYVRDKHSGKEIEISNCDFLTPMQEKMMATQPDMLIQYAHLLKKEYEKNGLKDAEVLAESYVTLNGKPSALIVDKSTVLSHEVDNFKPKRWILPMPKNH